MKSHRNISAVIGPAWLTVNATNPTKTYIEHWQMKYAEKVCSVCQALSACPALLACDAARQWETQQEHRRISLVGERSQCDHCLRFLVRLSGTGSVE